MTDSTRVETVGRDHWPAWALLAHRSGYLLAANERVYRISASLPDERESKAVRTAADFMLIKARQCDGNARFWRGEQ